MKIDSSIFLKKFFNNLNAANINYCVLRNYEYLPESLNGSDLDILVDKKDLKQFYKILNEMLNDLNGKIIIKYGELTPRICIAGNFEGNLYGLQLDVHEGILPYKSAEMFSADFVLSRKKRFNDIFVTDTNDSNIIAFFKEIYNNNKCKQKYFDDAKKSWQENKSNYIPMFIKLYNEEFVKYLEKIFSISKYDDFLKEIKNFSKIGKRILTKSYKVKLRNFQLSLKKYYRFFNPPGFTIAFIGVDGAGKTTIINSIKTPLNESVHNSLYYEHMRPNLIPNISELFSKKNKKSKEDIVKPHSKKPSGFFLSFFRLFYYSIDYIFGYWIKVYPVKVKKSSIWIFDRYFYDFLIDPARSRIKLPKFIIYFISKFIPEPDLVICLIADPKKIFKRKPELPLAEIERQIKELKRLSSNKKRFVTIKTDVGVDETVNNVFNIIVDKMSQRYIK